MEKNENRKKILKPLRIAILMFAVLSVFIIYNRNFLSKGSLLSKTGNIELPIYASGNEERIAVIDSSETRVLVLKNDGEFVYSLVANKDSNETFTTAKAVFFDENNFLYVLDGSFAGAFGENIERILKYSPAGNFDSVLYTHKYLNNDFIITKGKIAGCQYYNGNIYIVRLDNYGFFLEKLDVKSKIHSTIKYYYYPSAFRDISYFSIDAARDSLVFCTKSGIIKEADFSGNISGTYPVSQESGGLPWTAVRDGDNSIVYTDILNAQIVRLDTENNSYTTIWKANAYDTPSYKITQKDKKIFLASDNIKIIEEGIPNHRVISEYTFSQNVRTLRIALFSSIVFLSLIFLFFIIVLFLKIKEKFKDERVRFIFLFGLSFIFGIGITSVLVINEAQKNNNRKIYDNLEHVSRLSTSVIDIDVLSSLSSPDQYDDPAYLELKNKVRGFFNSSRFKGEKIYHLIINRFEDKMLFMCDLENSIGIFYPYDLFTEDSDYNKIYTTKEYTRGSSVENEGKWLFVRGPLMDKDGNVTSILETGYDISLIIDANRRLIIKIMIILLALFIAILLILYEVILLKCAYKKDKTGHEIKRHIVFYSDVSRLGTFILSAILNFPVALLSIYAKKLSIQPVLNLTPQMCNALPFAANIAAAALSFFVTPAIMKLLGRTKVSFFAAALTVIANVFAFFAKDIFYLSAAVFLSSFSCAALFLIISRIIRPSDFKAAYCGGLSVGIVFGSITAQVFDFPFVYLLSTIASLAMFILVLITLRSSLLKPMYEAEAEAEFKKPFVIPAALFFIVIPYALSVIFINYFMPRFALGNRLSEYGIALAILITVVLILSFANVFFRSTFFKLVFLTNYATVKKTKRKNPKPSLNQKENIKLMVDSAGATSVILKKQADDLEIEVLDARFLFEAAKDMLEEKTTALRNAEYKARQAAEAAAKAESTRIALFQAASATAAAIAAKDASEYNAKKAAEDQAAALAAEEQAVKALAAALAAKAAAENTLKAAKEKASNAVSQTKSASDGARKSAMLTAQVGTIDAAESTKLVEAIAASLASKAAIVSSDLAPSEETDSPSVDASPVEAVLL
ncbi:MAG: hypothetical protein Ta2F_17930 [Termitinemataceae bacterium]|nr:MAG: hypothetical protein Ta2F_17930 [Termitinemataceae bacterium]